MKIQLIIWSNERRAYWNPRHQGYTVTVGGAGRYDLEEATAICEGRFPEAGKIPNEVMLLAPEYVARDQFAKSPQKEECAMFEAGEPGDAADCQGSNLYPCGECLYFRPGD